MSELASNDQGSSFSGVYGSILAVGVAEGGADEVGAGGDADADGAGESDFGGKMSLCGIMADKLLLSGLTYLTI